VAIGNKIQGCKSDAFTINAGYRNHFTGENRITCSRQAGLFDQGEAGIHLGNAISYNGNSGFFLVSDRSLAMDNTLACNLPENITDIGNGNQFVNNTEKPCEPCEAPDAVCGGCSDTPDNCSVRKEKLMLSPPANIKHFPHQ